MPRKVFDAEQYGDYGVYSDTPSNDDEFNRRLNDLARQYGYYVKRVEVVEKNEDPMKWVDTSDE